MFTILLFILCNLGHHFAEEEQNFNGETTAFITHSGTENKGFCMEKLEEFLCRGNNADGSSEEESKEACSRRCYNTPTCVAWTFGSLSPPHNCWLKTSSDCRRSVPGTDWTWGTRECYNQNFEYECYHWTAEDIAKHNGDLEKEKEVCEAKGPAYIFTQGRNDNNPGCGNCYCCRQISGLMPTFSPREAPVEGSDYALSFANKASNVNLLMEKGTDVKFEGDVDNIYVEYVSSDKGNKGFCMEKLEEFLCGYNNAVGPSEEESKEACSRRCYNTPTCVAWTFGTLSPPDNCWLKTTSDCRGAAPDTDWTWGTRGCYDQTG